MLSARRGREADRGTFKKLYKKKTDLADVLKGHFSKDDFTLHRRLFQL
jgi:hypothetical protein